MPKKWFKHNNTYTEFKQIGLLYWNNSACDLWRKILSHTKTRKASTPKIQEIGNIISEKIFLHICVKKIPMWFFINCTWRIQKQCTYIGIMYIRVNHHLFVYTTTFHVKPQYTNMPVNYLFTQILFTICSLKASENLGILPTDASPYKLIFSLFQEIKL